VTVFTDPSAFASLPRVTSLRLSPDGRWLAATVQTVLGQPGKYVTSIWRIDATPDGGTTRLTRSAEGESGPEFLPDGSLLFASRRPDGQAVKADGRAGHSGAGADGAALWLLPAAGGEARRIAAPPGGISSVSAARNAAALVYSSPVFAGAADAQADATRRKARADTGVNAILHESGPIRYWDHDLGPDALRLFAGEIPPASEASARSAAAGDESDRDESDQKELPQSRDLTPDAGRALDEQSFELTPDGSAALTGWMVLQPGGSLRGEIAVVEVATGARRTLLASADADFGNPRVSPDGRLVLAVRSDHDTYDRPGRVTLVVAALSGDESGQRDLLADLDRPPAEAAWAPDSTAIYFAADDQGRRPVFQVALADGKITKVTSDDAAYSNLSLSPDGRYLYALRDAVSAPPAPVRIDVTDAGASVPVALSSPAPALEVPGRVDEVHATAADGTEIRGWLVLPAGASAEAPAPLVLWVHGGPQSSWNAWSWRWNPWLMAARGYAVLLPDPALSTGYGQHMLERGHGTWGANPYTDVMTITDAVIERPDIDAGRTAMMGGSFGGYMANWIAGHTGRFRAIVSHAGLWALDQFLPTTDEPEFWRRMFGDLATRPQRYTDNSPHLHVADITTPILVIHGDKDYRVPVGEALRMWSDLTEHSKVAKFLYFPDENHWILKPGDLPVWYETVFAFLAEHVLDEQWRRPELL
jgi:dipeptidyl aminopeptidase/acylaminoacyl peptidase